MAASYTPDRVVLDAVITADRRRRTRDAARRAARVAPVAAGGLVLAALLAYVARWPPAIVAVLAALGLVALGVFLLLARRRRPFTDEVAAGIDRDAGLSGELRSAYWFAAGGTSDAWSAFHLERAAARLQDVAWNDVYPPVRAARSWAASAALTLGALALAAWLPARSAAAPDAAPAIADMSPGAALTVAKMTPELREQLMKALADLDRADATPEETRAAAGRVLDLADLDPELRQQLERLFRQASQGELARGRTAEDGTAQDTNDGMSAEEQWALDDLTARLANEAAQRGQERQAGARGGEAGRKPDQKSGQKGTAESGQSGEPAKQARAGDRPQDGSADMEFVSDEEFEGGEMMFDSDVPPPPGGSSGGEGPPSGAARSQTAAEIAREVAQALRRELVEADKEAQGTNVPNDQRRKTEAARSALGYTRASGRAYDPARAGAAPQVPEGRRPLVERYFVREPPPQ